ncbi:thioredoxin family protein [Lichenifustis flavocetrariae]|uniref:Thioredoxin family protein n=1 Tax=Lichenifustis flavocetrariae TaxID=2949735 RepID=A0AA42CHH1_9HYPH|nr:thioredoxin family protein [Lichenifustis flavocetrariae]MCW6507264.1 thioredoxin family protein [Lichenifustis flavocetrariae]
MIDRRSVLLGFVLAAGLTASTRAFAFEAQPFSEKSFEAAQAAGKPILVEVTAPWCPTCKAQKPILSDLSQKPKFQNVVAFQIDFDSQKDLLRKFNVRMQSTLICFAGRKEVARSTGDTNSVSIEAMLDKSV